MTQEQETSPCTGDETGEDLCHMHFVQGATPQAFLDSAGRFETVNDALCSLLGRSREEVLGRPAFSFLDQTDPLYNVDVGKALAAGRGRRGRYDVVVRDASGRQVPLLIDVTVLLDGHGQPRGVACLARDLSDLRNAEQRLAGQDAFYRRLQRRSTDLSLVADAEANLVFVSSSVAQFLGYEPEEVLARNGFEFVHPEDAPIAEGLVAAALNAPGQPTTAQLRIQHASGEWRWVEETVTNLLDDPDIGGLVANLRDVTERVEAQKALERSEAQYRTILETAQEGILALAADGSTLFANERLAELVGFSLEEIYEAGYWWAFSPEDASRLHARFLTRAEAGPERYEVNFRRPDGEERVLRVSASPLRYEGGIGSLAMVSDVTSQRRAEAELRHRALYDPLTGVANRALLTDRLEGAAARQNRHATRGLGVLFVDVDNLKRVNDRVGHATGDALLQGVGQRIAAAVREVDTVARLGGDEFAILCEDVTEQDVTMVAKRIVQALGDPLVVSGQPFEVTASIGVALSPPHAPDELLRLADTAMYAAKEHARGSFLVFDTSMARAAERRTTLADDLPTALAGDALVVRYQPIVGLTDGRPVGVEALVRWQHPDLGLLGPGEVLDAARDAGLEHELDAAVLAVACRDMHRLLQTGSLPQGAFVSVNISAYSAMVPTLGDLVSREIARSGLAAHNLVLEITESSMMTDFERSASILGSLSRQGVRVGVDDFGTGYSSLAYLNRLPLDILKIDQSFIKALDTDKDSRAIVSAVVGMAEALSLHTVAEGVETARQAEVLRELGCSSAQGHLWSPAVSVEELTTA